MGHHITAIILKGKFDQKKAKTYDLIPIKLGFDLNMFHIDHYYSAYWQAKIGLEDHLDKNGVDYVLYPTEMALQFLIDQISLEKQAHYAIIATDYFGGFGNQWANVYCDGKLLDKNILWINDALRFLGVKKAAKLDEFDTVGLSNHRSTPDYLDKYFDLVDEFDV